MNRGFGFYYSKAVKSSASTIWKHKNFFKVVAYWFMELIGRVCLLGAIFDLANVRQAKIARKYREASIPENFKVASRANSVWTMLFAILLEGLMFLAGVIIIAIGSGILVAIGSLIANYVAPHRLELFLIVFAIPGMIVLLTYCFIMAILFTPTAYVVASNPGIGAGEAVAAAIRTMRERGKTTVFLTYFVSALIEGAIISLMVFGGLILSAALRYMRYNEIITLLYSIICIVGFFMLIPMFDLARKITLNGLFEDIALDSVNAKKNTTGINIKKYRGMGYDSKNIGTALPHLFDETEEEDVPLPNSEYRTKKRAEAIRREADYSQTQAKEAQQESAENATATPPPQENFYEQPKEEPQENFNEQPKEESTDNNTTFGSFEQSEQTQDGNEQDNVSDSVYGSGEEIFTESNNGGTNESASDGWNGEWPTDSN